MKRIVAYNVHSQRILDETLLSCPLSNKKLLWHRFFLGRYYCFGFLCMRIPHRSSRALLATFLRRAFGLFISAAFLWLFLRRYCITDPGCTLSGLESS